MGGAGLSVGSVGPGATRPLNTSSLSFQNKEEYWRKPLNEKSDMVQLYNLIKSHLNVL